MPSDSSRRVGLLGGTFDPPHLGHLVVAEEARVELGLDEVRLLVAGDPWMKQEVSSAEHRVAMARLAVADDHHLTVDTREVERRTATYTADTLEELEHEEPGTSWFFLAGTDALQELPRWHRAKEALARATFVALTRPGHTFRREHDLHREVRLLEVPSIDISSTDLRRRVAAGRAVRYQVPPAVHRYIESHGLYRPDDGD